MKKTFKSLGFIFLVSSVLVLFSCAGEGTITNSPSEKTSDSNSTGENASNSSLDSISSYVTTKYANGATDSRNSDQTKWQMANCHDPKLFQDDDGTYYVYATDASCGSIGKVGIHIRYSKDLVNWTGVATSALGGYWDKDMLIWEDYTASSDETLQNNESYTAYTWAPTVVKLNGLYYMYHGVNADAGTSTRTRAASSIALAIASSAKGPFYPASFISSYDADTQSDKNESDIVAIKAKLTELGVTYSQNFLVRYVADGANITPFRTPKYDSTELATEEEQKANWKNSNNAWFGCIDPEFVYDIAKGSLMEYTIGTNECYAMIYGSWLKGIALVYVDKLSLKPVATMECTYNEKKYEIGDELEVSLDEVNTTQASSGPRMLGARLTGGSGCGYEGAQLFFNSETNYYYLITSCGGLDYEYRCTLGRSTKIDGPYLDAGGVSMSDITSDATSELYYHNVGSKIIGAYALEGEYNFRCQGGLSVWRNADGQIIFANHARTNFQEGYYFYLQCHQMFFNADGWPVLNQNEYYNDYTGLTTDGKEGLSKLTATDIAGTYDTILTVRGTDTAAVNTLGIYGASSVTSVVSVQDAVPTASKTMTLAEDGSITGNYTGTWTLDSDGYSVTIALKDSESNDLGTFKGYIMHAVDWARKSGKRRTITFTTLCSDASAAEAGEFFWGNLQGDTLWTTSSDGSSISFSTTEDTKGASVPAFGVTASEGFTVSFKATLPSTTSDWGAKILSYAGCYVTIPNLDPYNNTISGSTLTGKNSFPTATGASLSNGRAYNSAFDGVEHSIKVVFTASTITFYLDGTKWVTYSSSALDSGMSEFVGYYITGLNAGAVTFNEAGLNITNLVITKGSN